MKQPYATKTPFGWCVAEPTNKREDDSKPIALSVFEFDWAEEKSAMDLHRQVEKFWAAEFYGFGNAGDGAYSIEEKKALEILKSSTQLRQGRYEIGFLWRTNSSQLLNNRRRD